MLHFGARPIAFSAKDRARLKASSCRQLSSALGDRLAEILSIGGSGELPFIGERRSALEAHIHQQVDRRRCA
jgi:hypothetical protein